MAASDRERFLRELGAELDAVNAQLDEYRQLRGPGGEVRSREELEELQRRRDEIRRRSEELEDFEGDSWLEAKRDIEAARRDLRESLEHSRERRP